MTRPAYGIDLGTTNSCIARYEGGAFRVLPIDGQATVPSVVAWDRHDWLVGKRALNHAMLEPQQAVRSIKRHMGDAHYQVRLGAVDLTPVEVSAKILAYLKEQAELLAGDAVREVVITVPAWFNDPQRRATLSAGELADLCVTRIINEPTAAALAYKAAEPLQSDGGEERWLVYDLGGGTFDVSILSVSGIYKEVLASCGNTFLGGDDFDHRIVLYLLDWIKDHHGLDVSEDKLIMARLRHLAERSKIRLSTEVEAPIRELLSSNDHPIEVAITLTRTQFNGMIHDYIESTLVKAHQALEEARVAPAALNRVLLVGGSTRIPLVQERVAAEFGIQPDGYVDADLSVVLGAAVQSALDQGLTCSQIVVDISPHALGIAVLGEEDLRHLVAGGELDPLVDDQEATDSPTHPLTFAPIIRKNSRLPAKFVEEFYTAQDQQEGIEVAVYQGESRNTRDNVLVGSFYVPIPPMPAHSPVHIGFEYDQSGLIHISVTEQGSTKALKSYTMDLNRSAVSNSELRPISSRVPLDSGEGVVDEAIEEKTPPPEAFNFLIEKVEGRLAAAAPGAFPEITELLARYKELLAVGDDAALDAIEERLYAWLDQDAAGANPSLI